MLCLGEQRSETNEAKPQNAEIHQFKKSLNKKEVALKVLFILNKKIIK